MVLDVNCYWCVYVVHVICLLTVPMMICNVAYVVLCTYDVVCLLYIWCCKCISKHRCCYVNVEYLVLCTYGVVCVMHIRFYVNLVLCAWLYTWFCVHVVLCTCYTCGDVCTQCHVHFMHVVLCTTCIDHMSCMWWCVQLVLCTHCTGGAVYIWHCVHIVQVVFYTCDVVHALCR